MERNKKESVITFKVDTALEEALRPVENRSEFIRSAIIAALDGACPLCHGTGILSPEQRKHMRTFLQTHSVHECDDCHATYFACDIPEAHS